jgi:hypothetical protein
MKGEALQNVRVGISERTSGVIAVTGGVPLPPGEGTQP